MDVSRETLERLEVYVALLEKWNRKINLVGRSTISSIWDRHIEDSIQAFRAANTCKTWVDLGSGAGLPGLVAAILAKEEDPQKYTVLIESDVRKATFCRTVIRELDLNSKVLSDRIESAVPQDADIVSARALAPLDVLLGYVDRHIGENGIAVLHKGADWENEVAKSLASWRFSVENIPSTTEPSAVILKIGDLVRV